MVHSSADETWSMRLHSCNCQDSTWRYSSTFGIFHLAFSVHAISSTKSSLGVSFLNKLNHLIEIFVEKFCVAHHLYKLARPGSCSNAGNGIFGSSLGTLFYSSSALAQNKCEFVVSRHMGFEILCVKDYVEYIRSFYGEISHKALLVDTWYTCCSFSDSADGSEYMVQKLGIEESKVFELCLSLYKNYGTTMAGLKFRPWVIALQSP
ncbi:hypothetical protein PanWU01x14_010480 [Parasponia andersonii]|uniref:Uncharacterized protein n=1 Tax=Parasponia andersonii TaxID=3476 RepID=A0A2P5E2P2_PARAD|nr:hypothetical protein PanWU01x14_010480 [Parasponia andersonii]